MLCLDPENASTAGSKSNVNIIPGAPPTGNSPETRTRRSSFDNPAANSVSLSSSSAVAVSGVKSSPPGKNGSGKHAVDASGVGGLPLLHSNNRLLSLLMLSEAALYKFLLFYLLCFQSSSYLRDNRSTDFLGDEPASLSETGFHEVIVDLLTKLAQTKTPSAATALSFKSFLSLLHDAPIACSDDSTGVGFVASGVAALTLTKLIRPSSAGVVLNTSTESMRRVLYVLVNDIVKNPYKVLV